MTRTPEQIAAYADGLRSAAVIAEEMVASSVVTGRVALFVLAETLRRKAAELSPL